MPNLSAAVVACTWGGSSAGVEETLTVARRASKGWGVELRWLVLGPLPEGAVAVAGSYDVAGIVRIEGAALTGWPPDACVEALAQYCAEARPRVVVFNQTFDARLVAPRLAGRLGSGVAMNAVDLEAGGDALHVTAAAYGGDTRVVYELAPGHTHVVGVTTNAIAAAPEAGGVTPVLRDVRVDLGQVRERIRVIEGARQAGPRLEDAQIIVAGGRGLGEAQNFHLVEELAEALGGMAGASRPIVDDGWVDASRQIGLTGKVTRPALYLAAGISGASQHMAGCSAAKTLVAVNRDPDAAIFRYARYGIVGDCLAVLPEITRAVKEAVR